MCGLQTETERSIETPTTAHPGEPPPLEEEERKFPIEPGPRSRQGGVRSSFGPNFERQTACRVDTGILSPPGAVERGEVSAIARVAA